MAFIGGFMIYRWMGQGVAWVFLCVHLFMNMLF